MGSAVTKRYSKRKQSSAAGGAQSKMLAFYVPALFSLCGAERVTIVDFNPNSVIVKAP